MSTIRVMGMCCAMLSGLFLGGSLAAQPPSESAPVFPGTPLSPSAKLATALQAIKNHQWKDAAQALQKLLDDSAEVLLPLRQKWSGDGKESTYWFSLHAEVNALLAKMPAEGRAAYQKLYDKAAEDLLERAKKDPQLLVLVVQRYQFTTAGNETLQLLAEQHSAAGRHVEASLCYGLWMRHCSPSVQLLFQACRSARLAGDKVAAERLRKQLREILNDEPKTLKEKEAELERLQMPTVADWPLFRGNVVGNGHGPAGLAKMKAEQWTRATIMDREDKQEPDPDAEAKMWIEEALASTAKNQGLLAPGAFPIVAGGKVIYRTYYGFTAVALKKIKEADGSVTKPGEVYWKSTPLDGCLSVILSSEINKDTRVNIDNWLRTTYTKFGLTNLVYENSMVGTLSTDHKYVFVIDDLAVPIPPKYLEKHLWNKQTQVHEKTKPLVLENRLVAFEIETGKLKWALVANDTPNPGPMQNPKEVNDLFRHSHWLGAPLPLGGNLFGLSEKNDGRLRLVCLNPETGAVLWMRTLATMREKFIQFPQRRTQTCQLAYQDGVLLCPTNAGTLLGFDLATQTLLWAHTYRPIGETALAKMKLSPPIWRASAPLLHDGQVIYAGPDDEAIHCLNLRDGRVRWRAKRDGDHYLAGVVGERIVLVGKTHCRALKLKDGGEVWKVAIDQPTGLGVLGADGLLTLPVQGRNVALWTVDTAKGQVVDRQILKGTEPLGNLVRHGDLLLSQSATRFSAYSLAK